MRVATIKLICAIVIVNGTFLDDRALMETSDSKSVAKPSNAKRSIAWLQAVAFVLGALLLVYVIRKVGVQPIFSALVASALASSWSSPSMD